MSGWYACDAPVTGDEVCIYITKKDGLHFREVMAFSDYFIQQYTKKTDPNSDNIPLVNPASYTYPLTVNCKLYNLSKSVAMTTKDTIATNWLNKIWLLKAAVELKSIVIIPNTLDLCNLKQLTVTVFKSSNW